LKNTVLFGAGQIGAMAARLMGGVYNVLCFADNSQEKWGKSLCGFPITSPEKSLEFEPDCVCLCVMDSRRAGEMEQQLVSLGFEGELIHPDALKIFDARFAVMRLLAEQIIAAGIEGDAAELGVFRGEFASAINAAFPERQLLLFDTFTGFDAADVEAERAGGFSRAKTADFSGTDEESVRKILPHRERAEFYRGHFPESFQPCMDRKFAFVSIDADLYAPTAAALPIFYDRLSPGGVLLIHDVNSTQFTGAGQAVKEFCLERGLLPMPLCDLHGSAVIRKEYKK
jgi:O-methyltransferase